MGKKKKNRFVVYENKSIKINPKLSDKEKKESERLDLLIKKATTS